MSWNRKPSRRIRLRIEVLEGRALLSAGALDTSFGGTGTVLTPVTPVGGTDRSNYLMVTGVAIQSDLKTVEVGSDTVMPNKRDASSSTMNLVVVRLNANGTPDTTFGSNGQVTLAVNGNDWGGYLDHMFSVAIQSDGKIVVAGDTTVTSTSGKGAKAVTVTRADLFVARLNSNGSLDKTFNGTGEASLDFPAGSVYACGVAIESNGDIVVAGGGDNSFASGTGIDFLVARWTPNGKLDASFGPDGQGYNMLQSGATCQSMAVDASGRILVGGFTYNYSLGDAGAEADLVRYTPNGLIDSSFGTGGVVVLTTGYAVGRGVEGIGFQSTGQIVVCGGFYWTTSGDALGVARLNSSDGSLDTSFGNGGYLYDPTMSNPKRLVVQPDDKILVAGLSSQNSNGFAVDRVLSDGSLDTTFGNGGQAVATLPASAYSDDPRAIALGSDGKITVVGAVWLSSSNKDWGAARFLSS